MDDITLETARNLETLEKTAALLRLEITKGNLTPERWLEVGKYMGAIGRATTNAAALIGVLVQKASNEMYKENFITDQNQNFTNGTDA